MRKRLTKIVSGGQSGADMGALIAARDLGIETGGWAPKGWLTENGSEERLLRSFGLIECYEPGYAARTRRNVTDSDGALLVGRYDSGGSRLTYEIARKLQKPFFHLSCLDTADDPSQARADQFRAWLDQYGVQILNVAGNRESQTKGIADYARRFLILALR